MSIEKNKDIARRFHACDPDDYAALMSEDFVGHDAMGHDWDREFQIAGLQADLEAFTGLHDDIHDIVAEEGKVAVRFTRVGVFVAKFESFEPTNSEVCFDVMELMHLRDGKIVEVWDYNDDAKVARTLRGEE